ncbi:hypothetical protein ACFY2R_25015 [Micromonospora olivasterospora]|uniref:Uncharacterized protein n=1 Tax=Micromonospora olivasterospora TaxID=1880 RepID=A0A562I5J4_MICOL|nr:hypothetical protein [Micromonospora olivasterospora]TWH65903.1 hypothetical protein JD77_00844 [Micromonospora olivasterospora]
MAGGTRGGRALARTVGAVAAGAVAGATAARTLCARRGKGRPGARPRPGRWEVVTVDRPPERVLPGGRWPEPLRRLGAAVEVAAGPAPGGRGTELAARPAGGAAALPGMAAHLAGDDPGRFVRAALREAKQLAETGELLRPDRSPLDGPAVPA